MIDNEYTIGEAHIENVKTFLLECAKQLTIFKITKNWEYFNNAQKVLKNIFDNFSFGDLDSEFKELINQVDSHKNLIESYDFDFEIILELDPILNNMRKIYPEIQNMKKKVVQIAKK